MLTEKNISRKSAEFSRIKKIYREAFPKKERWMFGFFEYRASHGRADFTSYWNQNELAGFSYILRNEKCVYVFYLAVSEGQRGKGFGSEMLEMIKEKYINHIIALAIEPPVQSADNYVQRVRRKNFYIKNGLSSQTEHMEYAGEKYEIMSFGGTMTDDDYQRLMNEWLGGFLSLIIKSELTTR